MPLLTTQSAKSFGFNSFLQGTTSYWAIDSYTVGSGGITNFTFNLIPQTYTHLQIRYMARALDTSATGTQISIRPNSDTASTYYQRGMYAGKDNSSAGQYSSTGSSNNTGDFSWYMITGPFAATNSAGIGVIDIFDYTSTNKKKTIKAICGFERSTYGQMDFMSQLWTSTAAISSLRLSTSGGQGFAEGSIFGLYGIKG